MNLVFNSLISIVEKKIMIINFFLNFLVITLIFKMFCCKIGIYKDSIIFVGLMLWGYCCY